MVDIKALKARLLRAREVDVVVPGVAILRVRRPHDLDIEAAVRLDGGNADLALERLTVASVVKWDVTLKALRALSGDTAPHTDAEVAEFDRVAPLDSDLIREYFGAYMEEVYRPVAAKLMESITTFRAEREARLKSEAKASANCTE